MQDTEFRLVTVEQDPEKENGVIINDFFLDGMDLKISFNTQKPLEPKVEMETQAVTKLSEISGGAVLGTDMVWLCLIQEQFHTLMYVRVLLCCITLSMWRDMSQLVR